ncbi:MAG: site-specific integrase, partial [Rhodospirillaceae bacterium]|nr:site-specific integrase [Rhodospirillaceae bacterium]
MLKKKPRKFTDSGVSKLKPPDKGQKDHWDALTPGFGLRISHGGTKTWLVQTRVLKNGEWKQTRITLGRYDAMTLSEAREAARDALKDAQNGKDPGGRAKQDRAALEKASRDTWSALADLFLSKYPKSEGLRETTIRDYRRALQGPDVQDWADRPVGAITRKDIRDRLDSVVERAPIHANRLRAYWGKFFGWLVEKDWVEVNPVQGVARPVSERSRDRFLTEKEIPIIWQAFDAAGPAFADMLKVLLLTGQREGEIAALRWSEVVDLDGENPKIELAPERTKNHRPHLIPLSPQAVEIIRAQPRFKDGIYVFTSGGGKTHIKGFSKGKSKIDAALTETEVAIPPWRIHDLRRTVATGLSEWLDIEPHIVESILNHISGTMAGVAGTYNRAKY